MKEGIEQEEKPVAAIEEKAPDMLQDYIEAELSPEELKIAKKRAKKGKTTLETEIKRMILEKNQALAFKLIDEFYKKLNKLGFILKGSLRFGPDGITPAIDLTAMSPGDIAKFMAEEEIRIKANIEAFEAKRKKQAEVEKE